MSLETLPYSTARSGADKIPVIHEPSLLATPQNMNRRSMFSFFFRAISLLVQRNFIFAIIIVNMPVVCYIYYKLNLVNYAWYNRRSAMHCRTPPEDMNKLIELSRDLHYSLVKLNITHWLAYGSLWGAIRYRNPLPWDTDVDIGVLQDDIKSMSVLKEELMKKEMHLQYSYWGGFYRVTRGSARADLMLFHSFNNRNGLMERVGIEAYVCFINYRKMHTFPSRLVQGPLPKMLFAGAVMPVPNGGLEIQKYHYPYDWWKESKPLGC